MPEKVEEKQGSPPPAPAGPPPVPRPVFSRVLRLWMALGALAWALALGFLLSQWGALGGKTLVGGRLSAGGAGAGAAAGIAALVVCLKRFGGRLDWFKPRQATAVRATAFSCLAALAFYGSYAFYLIPPTTSVWWEIWWKAELFGKILPLRPILFPSVGIFVTVMMVVYLLLNRPGWADFLVETEGEIKKVSWPPRKEYVGSALVVVVVVAVISLFLYFVDMGLSKFMQLVGIGF